MVLAGFFLANALVAEFMGVKLFSLEKTFGFAPVNWTLLWPKQSGLYPYRRGAAVAGGIHYDRHH